MKKNITKVFFIILLLLVLYLAAVVVWPYLSYILLALITAYTLRPTYLIFLRWFKKPWLSSTILVLIIFLLIFVPFTFILSTLARQGYAAITALESSSLSTISDYLYTNFEIQISLDFYSSLAISQVKESFLEKSFSFITSLVDIIIGFIITFFVLFYGFKNGDILYKKIVETIPLKKAHKEVLVDEIKLVTNAVIYGQLITALVQGVLGGIGFLIFGLPNPVFWGAIMAVLSFLPIVGTPIVFVPAGLLELVSGNYFSGIGILAYGFILVMNIDNVIKPFIISEKSLLNPALIFIGVIGGIKAFGFMGFVLGPLVLALFIVLVKVYNKDFKPSEELEKARQLSDELIIPLHVRPPDEHRKV